MDRWVSQAVQCSGGLDVSQPVLTQGTDPRLIGTALQLQNFEPDLGGGYRRINGFQKYSTTAVTGDATSPILGVIPVYGQVFAARKNVATTGVDIYSSTGTSWTKRTTTARSASVTKVRFLHYYYAASVLLATDGKGYAWRYVVGTGDALINGTGAPADPKFSEYHVGRLVLAGQSAAPSTVVLSTAAADTSFDGGAGALSFNVGDTITGLKTFRDELYILCAASIWKLVGTTTDGTGGTTPFAIVSVTKDVGCVSQDTIQEVGGDIIYLAPDGLRSIAATSRIGDVELSTYSTAINNLIKTYTTGFTEDAYSSCQIRNKSQYRLFIYQSALSDSGAVGFLGKYHNNKPVELATIANENYEWATLLGINAYSAGSNYDSNSEISVFGHPSNGFIYRLERGSDFAGTSIAAVYQSPHLTFTNAEAKSDSSNRKVIQKVDLYVKQEGTINTSLSVQLDLGATGVLQPGAVAFSQTSSNAVYDAAVYNTATYAAIQFPVFKQDLVGSGFTASFIFSSTGGDPFRIDSYNIQYAVKGKR